MNKDFNVMFLDDDGQLWYSKEFFDFQLKKKDIELDKFRPFTSAYEMKKEIKRLNNIFNQIEEYISSLELGSDRAYYNKEGYEVDVKDILKMMKELKGEDKE